MKVLIIHLLVLFGIQAIAQDFGAIKNYKVNYAVAISPRERLIAIRSFNISGQKYFLLADPQKLTTKIAKVSDYTVSTLLLENVQKMFSTSVYMKVLDESIHNGSRLQDAGIDYPIPKEKGITLTIDLCPSQKPLDRIIFSSLIAEFAKVESPVPVAISVSGKWMMKHESDLAWLKQLSAGGRLKITWINHSYNHRVNNLPLSENFLLSKDTDLKSEVLNNEQLMLKNGLVPSVFFRFPGLVSDQQVVQQISSYGLIATGSDAWLAKGQHAQNGSIVLIHGNGNEEIGVNDFIQLLQQKKIEVKNKQWSLFDLRQGLNQQFE